MIGEVRRHKTNNLYYVYEFHPDKDSMRWIRLDTFIWGLWREFPEKFATPKKLTPLPISTQKKIIKKYHENKYTIEGYVRPPKSNTKKISPKKTSPKKTTVTSTLKR